jgi:hypothetical protein
VLIHAEERAFGQVLGTSAVGLEPTTVVADARTRRTFVLDTSRL